MESGEHYDREGRAPYVWTDGTNLLDEDDRAMWDVWPGFHAKVRKTPS